MFDSTVNTIAPCNTTFAEEIYGHDIPEDRYGYLLLGGNLVPLHFLNRLETHLLDATFDATTVYSPRDMVGEAFYLSTVTDLDGNRRGFGQVARG